MCYFNKVIACSSYNYLLSVSDEHNLSWKYYMLQIITIFSKDYPQFYVKLGLGISSMKIQIITIV